ncbi:hypothetical protein [Butyrivibrio sp. AE3004]|uniref:hypothetical protein n=1 Tax=Butyrivibrio sp. AE3004 TaxID=1506994 RepID=UPI0018CC5698|nr:hypothetical protein [Butyrivibrio sp. AE3004]
MSKKDLILFTVVSAMLFRASSVRNAWCDVTMTFGMEISLDKSSSLRIWPDLSSKKVLCSKGFLKKR